MITPDSIVSYQHPTWGAVTGRVLRVLADKALCQDLSPTGAREWWPVAELVEARALVCDVAPMLARAAAVPFDVIPHAPQPDGSWLLCYDDDDDTDVGRTWGPQKREMADLLAHARTDIPKLAADLLATRDERDEALLTLAAERGDPAGALPGWVWEASIDAWSRGGLALVERHSDSMGGPNFWTFALNKDLSRRAQYPTARDAMKAADAALGPK